MTGAPDLASPRPGSPRGFRGPPSTAPGRRAAALAVLFLLFMAVFFAAAAAGQTGGDTLFSNLYLGIPFVLAACAAFGAAVSASWAVVRRTSARGSWSSLWPSPSCSSSSSSATSPAPTDAGRSFREPGRGAVKPAGLRPGRSRQILRRFAIL